LLPFDVPTMPLCMCTVKDIPDKSCAKNLSSVLYLLKQDLNIRNIYKINFVFKENHFVLLVTYGVLKAIEWEPEEQFKIKSKLWTTSEIRTKKGRKILHVFYFPRWFLVTYFKNLHMSLHIYRIVGGKEVLHNKSLFNR
jgi:hypothetical protein